MAVSQYSGPDFPGPAKQMRLKAVYRVVQMKKGKKRWITGFGGFLIVVLIFAIFFFFNFKTIQVSGTSMVPTLKDHQRVLVSKAYWLVGPIRDTDIIVLPDPHGPGEIIKRVIYSPGEDVSVFWRPESAPGPRYKYAVPQGCFYVLGDNRPGSEDSRKFGFVDASKILGKVVVNR